MPSKRPPVTGAPDFIADLRSRAAARPRRLVFPEATDRRVLRAVSEGAELGLFIPVLLGPSAAVEEGLAALARDPSAFEIVDPTSPEHLERHATTLHALRADRGVTLPRARELAADTLLQGALMVRAGDVDGSVAGAVRTTGDVVRAAMWSLGLAEGVSTVSSSFYMVFDAQHPRGPGVLTFTDAGVVPDPTPEQLCDIAVAAAWARRQVVGDEPRVAFLSYSTRGSAEGRGIDAVRDAAARFRARMPEVLSDGELQADAALVPGVAHRKAPDSPLQGRANVLVFPDLDAANIAYKLVQHVGGAHALGPILQGLGGACNDLSRGATPDDIVAVSCITGLMATGRGSRASQEGSQ